MHFSAPVGALLCVALLIGAAGCGGGDSASPEKREVRRVAQEYIDALDDRDSGTACELALDPAACLVLTRSQLRRGEAFGAGLDGFQMVSLEGDDARAEYSDGFLVLSDTEDGWRVDVAASEAAQRRPAQAPPEDPSG